jgi:hypothetical protein
MKDTLTAAEATSLFNIADRVWNLNSDTELVNVNITAYDAEECETRDFTAARRFSIDAEATTDSATMALRYAIAERLGVHYSELPVTYEGEGLYSFNFEIVADSGKVETLTLTKLYDGEEDGEPLVIVEMETVLEECPTVFYYNGKSWYMTGAEGTPAMCPALLREWEAFNMWHLVSGELPFTLVARV